MAYYYTDFNNRREPNTSWNDGIIFEKEDYFIDLHKKCAKVENGKTTDTIIKLTPYKWCKANSFEEAFTKQLELGHGSMNGVQCAFNILIRSIDAKVKLQNDRDFEIVSKSLESFVHLFKEDLPKVYKFINENRFKPEDIKLNYMG